MQMHTAECELFALVLLEGRKEAEKARKEAIKALME